MKNNMELHPLAKAAELVMHDIGFDDEVQMILNSLLPVLPWDSLTGTVENLQVREKAGQAVDDAESVLKAFLDATKGLAWLPVMCASMSQTACRLQSAGVPREMMVDTFRALKRFTEEYHRDYGAWGFDRQFWSWRQCCSCILRIGTLEYEQRTVRDENAKLYGIEEGDMILSVHIPSDACLNSSALADSFETACQFYRKFWNVTLPQSSRPRTVVCTTWLLSPELLPLLAENSGIKTFAKCFRLVQSENESKDYIIWLFGRNADINNLSDRTSLQRQVKQLMTEGTNIGTGTGELKQPYNTLRDDAK